MLRTSSFSISSSDSPQISGDSVSASCCEPEFAEISSSFSELVELAFGDSGCSAPGEAFRFILINANLRVLSLRIVSFLVNAVFWILRRSLCFYKGLPFSGFYSSTVLW
jgi:hypothetical protein